MWCFIFGFLLGSGSNDNYCPNFSPIPVSSHRSSREYVIFVDGKNIAKMLGRYNVEAETLGELADQFSNIKSISIKSISERLNLNFTTHIKDLDFEITVSDENIKGEYIRHPSENVVSQFDFNHATIKIPYGAIYLLGDVGIKENIIKFFLKKVSAIVLPADVRRYYYIWEL